MRILKKGRPATAHLYSLSHTCTYVVFSAKSIIPMHVSIIKLYSAGEWSGDSLYTHP